MDVDAGMSVNTCPGLTHTSGDGKWRDGYVREIGWGKEGGQDGRWTIFRKCTGVTVSHKSGDEEWKEEIQNHLVSHPEHMLRRRGQL